jgi:hypothetical protein
MPDTIDYSVASLRGFAGELPVLSRMPVRTAQTTGTGIRAVLGRVTLADDLDVRTINVDDVLDQFEDAAAGQRTIHSLQTYRAGFRRGLACSCAGKRRTRIGIPVHRHEPPADAHPSTAAT